MKNKTTAGILALLLGGLGVHKFYLGQGGMGLLYLIFCWTMIPGIVGFIEGIILLTMSDAAFNAKYNYALMPAQAAPQNIVVNVASTSNAGGGDISERIKSLAALKASGDLTEEEFQAQKAKLLNA